MGMLMRDLVAGLRAFVRRPGFALVATGTLALGIGAHATLFSVVDGVLLSPVDLPHPEELVVVRMQVDGELRSLTGPNVVDLVRESDDVLASAAGFWGASATMENPDGTREVRAGAGAMPGVFEALAVPIQIGRPWGPESMGTGTVSDVVITDRYWRSRFGADSTVVGSTVIMNGGPVRITGIMAPGFEFPTLESADFIFAPIMDPATISRAEVGIVSAGYLETLEIPLLRGRGFIDDDRLDGRRVALLSASLAGRLYGDEEPVGRRLAPVLGAWEDATSWAEVVGVVGDIRLQSLEADAVGTLYLANDQMPQLGGTLVVRSAGDPDELAGPVRDALLRVEPRLLLPTIQTMASLRSDSLARPRFNSLLLTVFSALALTISAVGIYGLLSYSVATRRRELGVRVAFGADRRAVTRLVLREGMALTALGLAFGLGSAVLASRAIAGLLFGIEPTDPATYLATASGVATIALVGCLLPALRAARGDVLDTLQRE